MIELRRERPPAANEVMAMIERQVALIQQQHREDLQFWQSTTMAARSDAMMAVCGDAVLIMEAQRQMGRPMLEPEPWPKSTQVLMRRLATDARR